MKKSAFLSILICGFISSVLIFRSVLAAGNTPNPPPVPIAADLSNVTFTSDVNQDVRNWPANINLSVSVTQDSVNFSYDKLDQFAPVGNDNSVGNGWIFYYNDGWYGTTTNQFRANHGNDNKSIFNEILCGGIAGTPTFGGNFVPVQGQQYGFMVSGQARAGASPARDQDKLRSPVVMAAWNSSITSGDCGPGSGGGGTGGTGGGANAGGDIGGGVSLPPIESGGSEASDATVGFNGQVVFNSQNGTWMVVSENAGKEIYARILDNNGNPLGDMITVAPSGYWPRVSYSPDSNKFFVTWTTSVAKDDEIIYGQFINPDGSFSGAKIQIDRGTFTLGTTSNNPPIRYDTKNKKFVMVYEDRGSRIIEVRLVSVSITGQVDPPVVVTTPADGTFNGAPGVAVNPDKNEYCVVYQHVLDGTGVENTSEVTVKAINAATRSVGPASTVTNNMFFLYGIDYSTVDHQYFALWSDYAIKELMGSFLSSCAADPNQEPFVISENPHNGVLVYNSQSNTFGMITLDRDNALNHVYIIDGSGAVIVSQDLFGGGKNGNFTPSIGANTINGTYAAIAAEDYATTKFIPNVGWPDVTTGRRAGGAFAGSVTPPLRTEGLPTDLGAMIEWIFSWSLRIVGIVIFLRFFYAGFIWFTARGNAARTGEAKAMMINALYGVVILFAAYIILYSINPDLVGSTVNLPGFGNIQPNPSASPSVSTSPSPTLTPAP
ncbi:MAG TPA: pilin [Candidatus Paceibacterota bacterium]|nr:pilin [Candidatus Paceibacterota bacterium]